MSSWDNNAALSSASGITLPELPAHHTEDHVNFHVDFPFLVMQIGLSLSQLVIPNNVNFTVRLGIEAVVTSPLIELQQTIKSAQMSSSLIGGGGFVLATTFDWSIDWLIGWSTDRITDWLIDWLIEWLNGLLVDSKLRPYQSMMT